MKQYIYLSLPVSTRKTIDLQGVYEYVNREFGKVRENKGKQEKLT